MNLSVNILAHMPGYAEQKASSLSSLAINPFQSQQSVVFSYHTSITLAKHSVVEYMGGLRLEAFKFGLYLTIPIFALLHFGDPEWYRTNVVPVSSVMGRPRRISIAIPVSG